MCLRRLLTHERLQFCAIGNDFLNIRNRQASGPPNGSPDQTVTSLCTCQCPALHESDALFVHWMACEQALILPCQAENLRSWQMAQY